MNNGFFLGIDTSNYTTSVALCDTDGKIVASLKKPLPVHEGERGLRQSDAVFAHIKNLPLLADELRGYINPFDKISAVGYSASPTDREGSYMPCFLSGKATAEVVAATHSAPVYKFSHQAGHIMAALYSSNALCLMENEMFASFHVSGGTTDILTVCASGASFNIKRVGGSTDLHAGQLIDRTGVALGLHFPCGPELEKLAQKNSALMPAIKTCVHGLECNLSGCENLVLKLYSECNDKSAAAAYVLEIISATIYKLNENLRQTYYEIPVVFAGGVMCNSQIKAKLSTFNNVYFAQPSYSSDNAAGTALLTRIRYINEGAACHG